MVNCFLSILVLFTCGAQAQNKKGAPPAAVSGIAIYLSKITLSKTVVSIDTLKFDRTKSIFKWQAHKKKQRAIKRSTYGHRTNLNLAPHDNIGEYNLYNAAKDSLFSRKFLFNQIYFVKARKPEIHWNIVDSTKKIGKFMCTMAKAHFRGRDYTVWFAPKISVSYGPWKLIGLPGLIMQAYDKKHNIYFSVRKVQFKDVGRIGPAQLNGKEKVVDLKGYKHAQAGVKKRMTELAHKLARKYAPKNANIKIEIPQPKFMEIFNKAKQ